jgi:release factor glutamine methyltransferase
MNDVLCSCEPEADAISKSRVGASEEPMTADVSPPWWTIRDALVWAHERLAGTDEVEWAAKILLAHVRECTLSELFAHPEKDLTAPQSDLFRALVERRAKHEPVPYLVGHCPFLELDLLVGPGVLIPRPETEVLVERALAWVQRREPLAKQSPKVADVGTGSGAIALGLAAALPQACVYALDSAAEALEIARQNAERHNLSERIVFLQGDLLAPLPVEVDLIVSNLPYVTEDEYASLPPGIRLYEPRGALVAGADGLDAIRRFLGTARSHLAPEGAIMLEIGAAQGAAVQTLASRAFPEAQVEVLPDYSGRDRVVRIDTNPRGER